VVTDAAPALADADEVYQVLRAARMAARAPLLRDHREQVKATLAWNIEKGLALTGEEIAVARDGQAEIFRRFAAFLADGPYDVLALPTVQVLPFPVEQEWVTEINGEPQATYIDWMRSCSRITVTLHPAITIPAGLAPAPAAPPSPAPAGLPPAPAPAGLPPAPAPAGSALAIPAPGGLPVGLQLAGRYGDDRRLLEIAAAIMALAAPG
jgi:Asp-tRNA(Asn)/Glu-tRNA(Gln) amidotransferase A subunit family amidase